MNCKILKSQKCIINQYYSSSHQALDIVGENYTLDYITAHSSGTIIEIKDGRSNMKGSVGSIAYGNYVKIQHQNGYKTLYAHLRNNINLKINQYIEAGQVIGYMGDSGNAYGKHLHFEVWKDGQRINPLEFINKDFPSIVEPPKTELKYKLGDIVEITGVYVSSTSQEKLRPLLNRGKITRIVEGTNNPYLLENGKVGWVNNDVIVSLKKDETDKNKYLSNKNYEGNSIVDALKKINIDSSYQYRTELAKINNITNYQGTSEQNVKLLNLLKQGLLKY